MLQLKCVPYLKIFGSMPVRLSGGALPGVIKYPGINLLFRNTFLFEAVKAARKQSRGQSDNV